MASTVRKAWVTLLTRPSYLPGAILLAYSLQKHKSQYPLIILYTPSLHKDVVRTLQQESPLNNAILKPIDPLIPIRQRTKLIAARFEDSWTKLQAFKLYECERLVFLDSDMLVLRNMDELFEIPLPANWIAATHACVCNLDHDKWAPQDWRKENCAYTGLQCFEQRRVPETGERDVKSTHTLLNSGLFIFEPTRKIYDDMLDFLNTSPLIEHFMFPDQDFLTEFFRGRWMSLGWQYNAIKTMRYWHAEMWTDGEVRNLHYIVDKPWSKRVDADGTAGYLGRDGITHSWWWKAYEAWEKEREAAGMERILATMRREVAKPLLDGETPENLHGNWKAGEDA